MRSENKGGGMGVRLGGERKGCVWSCLVCGGVALGEAVQRVVLLAVGSGAEGACVTGARRGYSDGEDVV